jgi:hypothetical protein
VLAALILITVFVLVTGVLPLAAAALPLLQARAATEAARAELDAVAPDAALPHLERAEARFRLGRVLLRNPVTLGARLVPGLSQNVQTAGALAAAGELTAGAARRVTGELEALGGPAALMPRDEAVPIEPVAALAPVLRAAADDLAEAEELAGGAPVIALAPQLADARLELLGELEAARPPVEAAAGLAEVLPGFLGAQEPRRYLLAASNPAELRGSGGLIGSHTVLEIEDGRLAFGEFEPTPDVEPVSPLELEPPNADYAARYDRFGSAGFFLNINMTPDFPSAGLAAVRLYEHVYGERLDGVILADPHIFAALLQAGGPLEVPGGRTLAADDVVAYVASEAYEDFDSNEERKRVLGAVAAGAVQRLLVAGTDGDPAAMVRALARAAGDGHLLVYAADPAVQHAFEAAGLAGALPAGTEGDVLSVALNNTSNNKVDFWLERAVRYDVRLEPDGAAHGEVEVDLRNGAPTDGYSSHVLGPNADGLEAGDARPLLSLFCGAGCETRGLRVDGVEHDAVVEEELGLPVHTVQERLPSGGTLTVAAERELAAGWLAHSHDEAGWYRLTLDPQTGIRPAEVALSITIPEGFEAVRATPGLAVDGRTVSFVGPVNGPQVYDVHFARPARERLRAAVERFWQRPALSFGSDRD